MVTVESVVAVPLAANVKALLANDAVTPVGIQRAETNGAAEAARRSDVIVLEPLAPV